MNMKPVDHLRCVLAHEDVVIFNEDEIKNMPDNHLDTLLSYYETTLETLAGRQVWKILKSLSLAEKEKSKRNKVLSLTEV